MAPSTLELWHHIQVHVLIVGAGVFGAWCAKFLADGGHQITVIDAYGPANARASSADHSRVIRCGYGADAVYSRWAQQSYADWEWLGRELGYAIVVRAGALFLGATGDAYVDTTHATLSRIGIASELLSPSALHARFPQIDTTGLGFTVLEAEAGAIRARAAVQGLVSWLHMRGVSYLSTRVLPPDELSGSPVVVSSDGMTLAADAIVYACGPWLPKMFPDTVGARIRSTRQEILHFGTPAGDDRFSLSRLPVWIDFQAGLYGIPDFDARGFKVGIDRHGPPIDPDNADRIVDRAVVDGTREFFTQRFPALANAPLVDSHVCQYENTHNGDLLIDRHPHWPNVWIVGGGSGHGFKHGPAVGRYVAKLIEGSEQIDPRFSLAGKQETAARAVY